MVKEHIIVQNGAIDMAIHAYIVTIQLYGFEGDATVSRHEVGHFVMPTD